MRRFINYIRSLLNRAHPYDFEAKTAIISGVIIFLFLFLFKPLNFSSLELSERLIMCGGFAAITTISIWVNYPLFAKLFPNQFNEDSWTVFSELVYSVYIILFIGVFNTLFIATMGNEWRFFWHLLLEVQLHTFLIAILPVFGVIMIEQNKALKQKLEHANSLTHTLERVSQDGLESTTHLFCNEAGKLEIQLPLEKILFIKAEGNYAEIFYENHNGEEAKHLIRTRLKAVSSDLPNTIFFQVHRSFLINGYRIERINGNARNYSVDLRGSSKEIPVARNKGTEFHGFIKSLNSSHSPHSSPIHT